MQKMTHHIVCTVVFVVLTVSIAMGIHFKNDKVWQCEHFLSKYQEELETVAKYFLKSRAYVSLDVNDYDKGPIPASVKEAMKTYFVNVRSGMITVLNEEGKWRWGDLHSTIPEPEMVSFEITYKPYTACDDTGRKEWRCHYFYYLCYSILTREQLSNRLRSCKYEVLPTEQPNWFIVIDDDQF